MEARIKGLKERLQYIGTRDLLGMIGTHFLTFANDAKGIAEQSDIFSKTKLMSPQKQYTYLAGLLMSTHDKSNGRIIQEDDWEIYGELEDAVQEITFEYINAFLNIDPKAATEDIKKNLVSMEAFISYFDMGILRYPEQTINLIRTLYGGFDLELEHISGLTTGDFIAFYELVYDTFEEAMNASAYAVGGLKEFLSSFNPYAVDIEQEYERFLSFVQGETRKKLQNAMNNLNCSKKRNVVTPDTTESRKLMAELQRVDYITSWKESEKKGKTSESELIVWIKQKR